MKFLSRFSIGLIIVIATMFCVFQEHCTSSMVVAISDLAQQCDPDILQQVESPKIRRICNFLQNYASVMQQISRDGPGVYQSPGALDGGVKRQDVDHVFLRFG